MESACVIVKMNKGNEKALQESETKGKLQF